MLGASNTEAKIADRAGGLFVRRERWGLSRRGCMTFAGLLLGGVAVLCLCIHPFLSVTRRVISPVLVVEGWIHPYAMEAAVLEFEEGGYTEILVTGGPVSGIGAYRNDFQTTASVGADNLRATGLPRARVTAVPARARSRDRTYGAALALRAWLQRERPTINRINVLTEDCHARRTRLLFRKALGPEFEVGIISVANPDYDPRRWWRYSEGVREVLGEFTAYVYARFFFWPNDADRADPATPNGTL